MCYKYSAINKSKKISAKSYTFEMKNEPSVLTKTRLKTCQCVVIIENEIQSSKHKTTNKWPENLTMHNTRLYRQVGKMLKLIMGKWDLMQRRSLSGINTVWIILNNHANMCYYSSINKSKTISAKSYTFEMKNEPSVLTKTTLKTCQCVVIIENEIQSTNTRLQTNDQRTWQCTTRLYRQELRKNVKLKATTFHDRSSRIRFRDFHFLAI